MLLVYLSLKFWVFNLNSDLHGLFIKTGLVKGLSIVDLVVLIVRIK